MQSLHHQKSNHLHRRAALRRKRKLKKRKEEERLRIEWELLQNTSVLLFMLSFFRESVDNVFGGNKNREIPRVRKDLKKDIIEPLGEIHCHRSYRMSLGNFYKLHSLLKLSLEAHFFPRVDGKRDPSKYSHLIGTAIGGAIDGLLIWTLKPTAGQCKNLNIANDGQFRCHRKDKLFIYLF